MRTLLFLLLALSLVAGSALAAKEFDPEPTQGVRVDDPGPDAFGYMRVEAPADWVFQDITGTGTFIVDGDDSYVDYNLAAGFNFYGDTAYLVCTPSTNGGITFDGTYMNLSNVCPLPDDQSGVFLFNDDLYVESGSAGVYGEYFEICPVSSGVGPEPCTIIMWDEVRHYGSNPAGYWDMEIVLFHNSFNIGMLFDDRFVQDAGGTTGIDSGMSDVDYCLTVACDNADVPAAGGHYLILHPGAVATTGVSFSTLKATYR